MIKFNLFFIVIFYYLFVLSNKTLCLAKNINEMERFEDEKDYCSDDSMVNKYKKVLLPDDRHEYKYNHEKIRSIKQYGDIFNYLNLYLNNLTTRAKPYIDVMYNQINNKLLTSDIENECIKSLRRIKDAIVKREKWALNCELDKI